MNQTSENLSIYNRKIVIFLHFMIFFLGENINTRISHCYHLYKQVFHLKQITGTEKYLAQDFQFSGCKSSQSKLTNNTHQIVLQKILFTVCKCWHIAAKYSVHNLKWFNASENCSVFRTLVLGGQDFKNVWPSGRPV